MSKTIQLAPWQLTAIRAGRLKAVWVPFDVPSYHEPCPNCALPYAAGDLVQVKMRRGIESAPFDLDTGKALPELRITAPPTVRRVSGITLKDTLDAGCVYDGSYPECNFRKHWQADHPSHPWETAWACCVSVEEVK